jgi:hypothetical protein
LACLLFHVVSSFYFGSNVIVLLGEPVDYRCQEFFFGKSAAPFLHHA